MMRLTRFAGHIRQRFARGACGLAPAVPSRQPSEPPALASRAHATSSLRSERTRNPLSQALHLWLLLSLAGGLATGCARSKATREMRQFKGSIIGEPQAEPVLAGARPSVVAIEAFDTRGKALAFGTGFYIQADQVVTCMHVIEAGARLQLVLADGTRREVAGVYGTDQLMDLAVLWVTNAPSSGDGLRLRNRPANVGEAAYLIAAPKQLPITATKGSVIGEFELGSEMINQGLVLSVPAVSGFSGGPALDADGAVIGVLSSVYRTEVGSASVAVPVSEIRGLTDRAPEPWAQWRQSHPPLDVRAAAAMWAGQHVGLNQAPQALAHFVRATEIAPECALAWVRRGFCLYRMGRYAEAAGSFHRALAREPGLVTPRLLLSMCLGLNSQPDESLIEAEAVGAQRPRSPFAQTWLAAARLNMADPLGAMASMRTALELAPEQPTTRNLSGRFWDNLGCLAAAERDYREAIRLQPKMALAWANLGALSLESGHTTEAADECNRAIAAMPNLTAARYLLFLLAAREGNERETRRKFEDFLSAERSNLKQSGDPHRAESILRVIEKHPWHESTALHGVTQLFLRTHRKQLARFSLEFHLERQPETTGGWNLLAGVCLETGRFTRAREAAEKAIAQKPDNAYAFHTLGLAHGTMGNLEAARQAFTKSLVFGPRQPEPFLGLACVEARAGNREKSEANLAEAKRLKPDLAARFATRPDWYFADAAALNAAAAAH